MSAVAATHPLHDDWFATIDALDTDNFLRFQAVDAAGFARGIIV